MINSTVVDSKEVTIQVSEFEGRLEKWLVSIVGEATDEDGEVPVAFESHSQTPAGEVLSYSIEVYDGDFSEFLFGDYYEPDFSHFEREVLKGTNVKVLRFHWDNELVIELGTS